MSCCRITIRPPKPTIFKIIPPGLSRFTITHKGLQGPKGEPGEGISHYTGDLLALYILAKN